MEDLYRVLNVDVLATAAQMKKSYQELALQYHPDKYSHSGKEASSERFIKVNRAYKILSDPELRAQYDVRWKERCLAQAYPIQETVDFEEFEEIITENEDRNLSQSLVENEPEKQYKGSNSAQANRDIDDHSKGDNQKTSTDENFSLDTVYVYTCRCGGNYMLTQVDVRLKFDIVCCDSCSLSVKVIYTENPT